MRELTHPLVDLGSRWAECVRTPEGYTTWPLDGLINEIITGSGMTEFAQGIAVILGSYAAEGSGLVPVGMLADNYPGLRGQLDSALQELADYGYIGLVGGDPE